MDDAALPLFAHLEELRARLIKALLAWFAGTALAFYWAEHLLAFLLAPAIGALGDGAALQVIAPQEQFFTYLKCALLAGFFAALPIIFWQVWAFVAPGLYAPEKKFAAAFTVFSTVLFTGGAAFGHAVVFPLVFEFFESFSAAADFVIPVWTLKEVFSLTARLFLAFGLGFELPLAVYFLAAAGVVSPRRLLAGAKYAALGAFVFAALLTPPDFISQVLLALPLIALYLLGIAAAMLFTRKSGAP